MIEEKIDPRAFQGTKLSDSPSREEVSQLVRDYQLMLVSVIKAILDRYDRNGDYPFVDTKLSLLDGRDFEDSDEVRGKNTIYPWIQGRGLEALVLHEAWLRRCDAIDPKFRDDLCKRIKVMVDEVLESMEQLRAKNGGRLFFMMDRSGQPVKIGAGGKLEPVKLAADAPSNYSDLFYVKGMVAAADMLGEKDIVAAACKWYDKIHRDICGNAFESDQQKLCPENRAVGQVKGRFLHGPRMIAIGAALRFLDVTGDGKYHDYGVEYIDYILEHHINTTGDCDCTKRYDMWEFVGADGQKYIEPDGALLSDPGHATEFVGLALKLLRISEQKGTIEKMDEEKLTDLQCSLVAVLLQNYANGMSPMGYGIVKSFNLVSRKPVSSNMPWWSLPETMRAAMEAARVVPGQRIPQMGEILIECSNAFIAHYVRPELHLMAYQTIDENAEPVDEIPATPDADPGYHTGLCIIDAIDLFADEVIAIKEGTRE
ncbi:MAG: AGE family epimerase/isomerase [Phycisphaerae bacterium]|nr:AGE family epimerase/isomerase [Phycisphaerae bacterium]